MNFKQFDPRKSSIKDIYHLMISGVAPRPIALVSSLDKKGTSNLAPFSFFNAFGANPPIVGFSPTLSGKTGLPKDTLLNIKETAEFTISIVTSDMIEQVSLSSCEYNKDIDEFLKAGFNKRKSNMIKPPGVVESPFIMECKLNKIIELGNKPASGNLILGEVVLFHIDLKVLNKFNEIDPIKIDQVGRSGGPWYTEIKTSLFKLDKPTGLSIGFDNIPIEILNSNLTGNQLAKFASVKEVPKLEKKILVSKKLNEVINEIDKLLNQNKIHKAWQLVLSWKLKNE